jgi:hypothetical protein
MKTVIPLQNFSLLKSKLGAGTAKAGAASKFSPEARAAKN